MSDKKTPNEIPTKKIPNNYQPEKAPDTEPSKNNPRNPKEDKIQFAG